MNIKQIIIFTLLCPIFFFANAQNGEKDSILHQIELIHKMSLDTAQVSRLISMGYNLMETDSLLSKQLLEEALAKSLSIKELNAITSSYRVMGIWYSFFNNVDKALEYYRLSLKSATSNNNQYLIAGANLNIGNIKYWKGEYDSCIHFYLRAVEIFENPKILDDKTITEHQLDLRKSNLYSNISTVFNTLKNLNKADEYIDKAIAIAQKYSGPADVSIVARYMQIKADNYSNNGQTEKALRLRLQFLPQMESGTDLKTFLQGAYQSIAQEYFSLEKIDSSKLFAQKSLQLAEIIKSPSDIANANLQLGRIAMAEKQYDVADKYLEAGKDYYQNINDPPEQRDYFDVMRELKFAEGKYKDAYKYFQKFHTINDSLLVSEKAKEFSEREIRYQTEKKDTQLKLQETAIRQKSTLNYIFIGSTVVLLLLCFLSYRNYQQKRKLQQLRITELETEKQLTATEAVLKGEEQERTRLAKDLHDGLGGMLSGIKHSLNTMKGNLIMTADNAHAFERSVDMLDSSIREMRRVAHNMMPEALVKFGLDAALSDFCNDINQSGALQVNYQSMGLQNEIVEQTAAITIYRIVQELINNTMKHAAAKTAIVQLSKENNNINVTVEDDGKGFDTALLRQANGIGWSNIKSRIEYLKGTLDVRSAPGNGTSVHIELTT